MFETALVEGIVGSIGPLRSFALRAKYPLDVVRIKAIYTVSDPLIVVVNRDHLEQRHC